MRKIIFGLVAVPAVLALAACSPTAVLSLKDGSYTCGPVAGSDMEHMVVLTGPNGNEIDMFATVADGDIASLDLGPYDEVSDDIDGFTKQSNSRFNVRIVNNKGGNGKFFTTGDPVDDQAGYGNWLLCDHDG